MFVFPQKRPFLESRSNGLFFLHIPWVAQSKPCPILSCDILGSWWVFISLLHSEGYMESFPLFSEMFFVQLTGSCGSCRFFKWIARSSSCASFIQCLMETWEAGVRLWSERPHSWLALGLKPRQHGFWSSGLGRYAVAPQKLETRLPRWC